MSQQTRLVQEPQRVPRELLDLSSHWNPGKVGSGARNGMLWQNNRRTCLQEQQVGKKQQLPSSMPFMWVTAECVAQIYMSLPISNGEVTETPHRHAQMLNY